MDHSCRGRNWAAISIAVLVYETDFDSRGRSQFRWYRYPSHQAAEPEFVPFPIRWGEYNSYRPPQIVTSLDGKTYVVFCTGSNGGFQVFEWNYAQLRLVFHQSEPRENLKATVGSGAEN